MVQSRSRYGFVAAAVCTLLMCGLCAPARAQGHIDKAWDILKKAASDSNTDKRAAGVAVLALLQGDSEAQAMAEKALSDEKPVVRTAAANALGAMEAKSAIPALKNAIRDKDVSVVLAATHALYVLKDPTAYEVYYAVLTGQKKSGGGLIDDQKKMLSDPKKMAQLGFEQGIGFIPFAGLGLTALGMITKDDTSPVRAAAAKVLAKDPDPKSGDALVDAAFDKSWIVRAAALNAISERGDFTLGPRIEAGMDDEKEQVRYIAAAAVIHLQDVRTSTVGK
ncbi:HEAT repeat domain-containing protein [Occallatibacter riparius]|uniref:HEAT repeat domain-containing protein n=1 Tax=Occallatibacter riparius TaxID=1002689 RepID=A0A9J7BGJ1_9BACT|nr:HEAT repeat domain-containing protein [Occallatibacter riparius]UWZ81904.1 HEAT repeat domain-containing protein [Occallatibacter riparius]